MSSCSDRRQRPSSHDSPCSRYITLSILIVPIFHLYLLHSSFCLYISLFPLSLTFFFIVFRYLYFCISFALRFFFIASEYLSLTVFFLVSTHISLINRFFFIVSKYLYFSIAFLIVATYLSFLSLSLLHYSLLSLHISLLFLDSS